ncbi:hypothetical protein AOLI_G00128260 [Acnodon oligacanthus]
MSPLIHLGVLLIFSAVNAEPDALPNQSHVKHELEMLTQSVPGIMRDWKQEHSQTASLAAPPKWQRNPVFCCVCQDIIKQTKPKIYRKIQTQVNKICSKFIKGVKEKCENLGTRFRNKVLKMLFPGPTPKDTCRRVKLCMY